MSPCFALSIALAAQAPKVTLTFFQEHFIVRDGAFNESAPLRLPPETPKLSTLFRKNATFAVWDERGLTIRVGSKIKSTKLPEVSTSPRAFPRDELVPIVADIRKGNRSKDVAGLSGAVRIGSRVFFLARWEDKKGKPWAEALLQVDLSEKFPEPKFLGREPVLSLGDQPIDDRLFILDAQVSYVAHTNGEWGLEQYNPKTGRFTFNRLGDHLENFVDGAKPHMGLFVERTTYGTTVAGRIDLAKRTRKTLAESRSKMKFLDGASPECLIVSTAKSTAILDAWTGAQLELPSACSARRTARGIVIWTPTESPKKAWLYDPGRWQGKAWWNPSVAKATDGD